MHVASGKRSLQHRQLAILGPEVVAPLADAVRLVNGKPLDPDAGEQIHQTGVHQPLGRRKQQPQLTSEEPAANREPLPIRHSGRQAPPLGSQSPPAH